MKWYSCGFCNVAPAHCCVCHHSFAGGEPLMCELAECRTSAGRHLCTGCKPPEDWGEHVDGGFGEQLEGLRHVLGVR